MHETTERDDPTGNGRSPHSLSSRHCGTNYSCVPCRPILLGVLLGCYNAPFSILMAWPKDFS